MNFIAQSNESHQYMMQKDEKGESILESMMRYGVIDEVSGSVTMFTQTEEDLELKKLIWT